MMRPPKNAGNPHQLTTKQKLVIAKVIAQSESGKGINLPDAHRGIYGSTKPARLRDLSVQNMKRENFREALMEGLMKRGIVGRDGKVEEALTAGLEAVDDKGNVNYEARLKYVQEINKISGVYAPERTQTAKFNLNIDLTSEQINEKIKELQGELAE